MTQVSPSLIAALAAWLATTAIILILVAIARRREERRQALDQRLRNLAQAAVTRHTWARGAMGTRDDWQVFNRTMENLPATLQQWQEETAA